MNRLSKLTIKHTFSLFCILLSLTAFAHEEQTKFLKHQIFLEQGLSSSAVLSIFQDQSGYVWFGTYDGLNRWDGTNMLTFRDNTLSKEVSFNSNIIRDIKQADNDCIWLETFRSIVRFSLRTNSIESVDKEIRGKIYSNSVGQTWRRENSDLYYYNVTTKKFVLVDDSLTSDDTDAFMTETGNLWLFSGKTNTVTVYNMSSFGEDGQKEARMTKSVLKIHDLPIKHIYGQRNTFAFVDSQDNIFLYDMDRRSKMFIRNLTDLIEKYGTVHSIITLYDDIFIAFDKNGLMYLDPTDNYREKILDQSMRVFDMFKDISDDFLWVATDGEGAFVISMEHPIGRTVKLKNLSPHLKRQVRAISTDRYGGLWFGLKGDGVVHIPDYDHYEKHPDDVEVFIHTQRYKLSDYQPTDRDACVFTIKESRYRNGLWIGGKTLDKLTFYSFDKSRMLPVTGFENMKPYSEIHGIHEVTKDEIWFMANQHGLLKARIVGSDRNAIHMEILESPDLISSKNKKTTVFFALTEQGDSVLWLGHRGEGVFRYDLLRDTNKNYPVNDLLGKPVGDIISMYQKDSTTYVGSTSGLYSFQFREGKVDSLHYVGLEEGLENDLIHGILLDRKNNVWMATNKYLQLYSPRTGKVCSVYGNGIDVIEYSDGAYYHCPYTDRLFFGGCDGLVCVFNKKDSEFIDHNDYRMMVNLAVHDPKTGHESNYSYVAEEEWKIKDAFDYLTISFSYLDYAKRHQIQYSYKLEGYDKNWSTFDSSTEARYVNVPSGKYTFKVRYRGNSIDNHEDQIISVPLVIRTRWYRSAYFLVPVVLLGIALLVCALYFWRKSIILHYEEEKNRKLKAKQHHQESQEFYGVNFVTNNEEQKKFLSKFIALVEESYSNGKLSIDSIASELCVSTRQFYRCYNEISTISPVEFICQCRLDKAVTLLETSDLSTEEIATSVGWSRSYFHKQFMNRFNMTPREYRLKHKIKS